MSCLFGTALFSQVPIRILSKMKGQLGIQKITEVNIYQPTGKSANCQRLLSKYTSKAQKTSTATSQQAKMAKLHPMKQTKPTKKAYSTSPWMIRWKNTSNQ